MPKRNDLHKILVLGAGPVVVGQGIEFDYAGVQACRALKEAGYEVIVANSNPATVMTDPDSADRIYIEPLTPVNLEKIISKERPDALLLNYGGQASFDLGNHLAKSGCLAKYELKLVGISEDYLNGAERYKYYLEKLTAYKIKIAGGSIVRDIKEGMNRGIEMGFPIAFRTFNAPAGAGTVMAYNREELEDFLQIELSKTPDEPVLLEESLLGWKEFVLEVLGDGNRYMLVGSLEKLAPMGIHYGDSIAVTPIQSLSTGEYQKIAGISENVAKAIQLTGRINIQVAQNPLNGDFYVLGINYAVTQSMALIAKATGLPIASIAARLMVGYQLEELIPAVQQQPAGYVAVKLPRFDIIKFPTAEFELQTAMKSTGQVMAIGSNFKAALQKGLRSLEIDSPGFGADERELDGVKLTIQDVKEALANPNPESIFYLRHALKLGLSIAELNRLTKMDPYFLTELKDLVSLEKELTTYALYNLTPEIFLKAKQWGFSDGQLAYLLRSTGMQVREAREKMGINLGFKAISSRARISEVTAVGDQTVSYYSFYRQTEPPVNSNESTGPEREKREKVIIIGPGPNRIERGGEFDYSLVHASLALRKMGYETLIVNNNPGALSTDCRYSDKQYWEPIVCEEIQDIILREKPIGAILQFSGQFTPEMLTLFEQMKVPVLDQSILNIEGLIKPCLFNGQAQELKISQLPSGKAADAKKAQEIGNQIGYPVIIRSQGSYPAEIAFDAGDIGEYFQRIGGTFRDGQPFIWLEKLIEEAIGVEVSCITDGESVAVCAVMEQIEEAAINVNDSAVALPPYSLGEEILANIKSYSRKLALDLKVKGLVNFEYIIKHHAIYLRAVNRPITRLIPVLVKATGTDWIEVAMKVIMGQSLRDLGLETDPLWRYSIVKEAVFSFERFPGVDTILGPETRSTGEVIGLAGDFGLAFIKSQLAAGEKLPVAGTIFLSIKDEDKRAFIPIIKQLVSLGFKILTTEEIAAVLDRNSIPCYPVKKIGEGRPNILDHMKNGDVQWIFNTPAGRKARREESLIRSTAVAKRIPIVTTVAAAQAVVTGIERYLEGKMEPIEIRDLFEVKVED